MVPIDSVLSLALSIDMWLGKIKAQAELIKNLSLNVIFLFFRFLISLSSASKARTTPLPIKHLERS